MEHIRITFELDASDWHAHHSERLWAEPVSGSDNRHLYRLLNSPFFARGISYLDVVEAHEAADGALLFDRVAERSGHSTFMVLVPIEIQDISGWSSAIHLEGASMERAEIEVSMGRMSLYSIDVPESTAAQNVECSLADGERRGSLMYQVGFKAEGGDFAPPVNARDA